MRLLYSSTASLMVLLTASVGIAAPSQRSDEISELREMLLKQQAELQLQKQEIERQRALLQAQENTLYRQDEQYKHLSGKLAKFTSVPISEMQMNTIRGAGTGTNQATAAPVSEVTVTEPGKKPVKKAAEEKAAAPKQTMPAATPEIVGSDRKPKDPERPPEIAAYIEEGGVLLPRGTFVVTPEFGYLNSSATRVAIEGFSIIPALNIGLFEISELARDTMTAAVGARYGLTNKIEIEAKIPYVYRSDSTKSRPIGVGSSTETLTSVEGMGLGDVEVGAHYQINNGKGGWPYLIGNLRYKATTGTSPFDMPVDPTTGLLTELPTGSGFMAVQPSVTAIYPSDPGVFYGNFGYLYNFSASQDGSIGDIDPGDSVSASLGLSIALNDLSSFSLGYSHNTVFKTRQNGEIIPNSRNLQVGTVNLGFAQKITESTSVNFSVNAGVTEDAPDTNVIVRVPLTLDFFN